MSKKIKVAWMYPDLLNLHGDRGNAIAFELVAKKLKVNLVIERIDDLEQKINLKNYDILLFNAGELKVIKTIREKLIAIKQDIKDFIENNKVILVTGTTGALFANNIKTKDGNSFNGLNILDIDICEREMVIGDDLYYKASGMEIMSSQIQMIDIDIKEVRPFGKIKYGYGNCGDGYEGARYNNLIFTNSLGPVLVKNPWFTEYLINLVCKNKKIKLKTRPRYNLEKNSLKSCKDFIVKKLNYK